jgi:DNA-directed RNA polymerase III subunit RPC4
MPGIQVGPEASKETPKVDGVIGHVEIYRSGTVKMRLGNGIVLNVWRFLSLFSWHVPTRLFQVSEATRPSFLQQAVHLDVENKKLHVLGEVNKRFVVSPDLDTLLSFVELADNDATTFDNGDLIKMDTV